MSRVLMNFQLRDGWHVHFIEADCRTTIGQRTHYFSFANEGEFRAFVSRCNIEDTADFEHCMRAWSRGSTYCNLTPAQYAKLHQVNMKK
jgi:hypothetical protein